MKSMECVKARPVVALVGLCLLAFVSPLSAATTYVLSDPADSQIQRVLNPDSSYSIFQDASGSFTFAGLTGYGLLHYEYNAVFVFQLPSGTGVSDAHLSFVLTNRFGPFGGIDLYGLGFRNTPTVLDSDFFAGPLDAGAALIQNDIYPTGDAGTSAQNTSLVGDAALMSYINAQYLAGGAGQYVFLRFSPDVELGTGSLSTGVAAGMELVTANAPNSQPVLGLTVVPEPTCTALLIVGLGAALTTRWHRHRLVRS